MSYLKKLVKSWNMWRDERRSRTLFKRLVTGEFNKVWSGEELAAFEFFLIYEAVPAKGFLITLPIDEGGLVWIFYPILETTDTGLEMGKTCVAVPKNANDRVCPTEWRGYPIRRAPND